VYLAAVLFAFFLGWSMIQIPYYAWSGELSAEYHPRTRVATYQAVSGSIALLLVLVLPTITDQLYPHDGVLELGAMGGLILALLVPLLLTLTVAQGLAQGSGNLMLRAIVADVADVHRLETGVDRTALFFSVFSISIKLGVAAAVGIGRLPISAHSAVICGA
jgi:Na+/melibiose symporter-like transporter